jgi:hypothetical protein
MRVVKINADPVLMSETNVTRVFAIVTDARRSLPADYPDIFAEKSSNTTA